MGLTSGLVTGPSLDSWMNGLHTTAHHRSRDVARFLSGELELTNLGCPAMAQQERLDLRQTKRTQGASETMD